MVHKLVAVGDIERARVVASLEQLRGVEAQMKSGEVEASDVQAAFIAGAIDALERLLNP